MKDATKEILNELGARGYRITKAREKVVETLLLQSQPISIQGLCASIIDIDEVSVYRTVALLVEEGFVEELALPGEAVRYALSEGHHHHAVCTACGFTDHIDCKGGEEQTSVPTTFKSIASHEVTLYGLCKKCA